MKKIGCVLLVDDDDTTNFVNQLLLEDLKVTQKVLTANNGGDALQLLKQQWSEGDDCPQLLLLDLSMPEMDGFEFLEAYEKLAFEQKSSLVIVVLTTSMNPGDFERLSNAPIKGVINKPLTEEKVQDLLQQHFYEEIG